MPVPGRGDAGVAAGVLCLGVVDAQAVLEVRVATLLRRPAVRVGSGGRVMLYQEGQAFWFGQFNPRLAGGGEGEVALLLFIIKSVHTSFTHMMS